MTCRDEQTTDGRVWFDRLLFGAGKSEAPKISNGIDFGAMTNADLRKWYEAHSMHMSVVDHERWGAEVDSRLEARQAAKQSNSHKPVGEHADSIDTAKKLLSKAGPVEQKVQIVAWFVRTTRIHHLPQISDVLGISYKSLNRWRNSKTTPQLTAAIDAVQCPRDSAPRVLRGRVDIIDGYSAHRHATVDAVDPSLPDEID